MKKEEQIIRMGLPPFRIELLTSISGVKFIECYKKRNKMIIDNTEIGIIDLINLKKNKKSAGRIKDLLDLENLPNN